MCPFLLNFCFNLNKALANSNSNPIISLSDDALRELNVWKNFLLDNANWCPICHPSYPPPICTKTFYLGAAGFRRNTTWTSQIGCGVVGLNEILDTCLAFQFWWPKKFISEKTDSKGSLFGDKTSTLEQIGILLPLLLIPDMLFNQHIVSRIDNIACAFGHQTV
jgi:hypothetical protein